MRSAVDLATASREKGVHDERLLAALARLPRVAFVPARSSFAAYRDEPVRITHGQVTTQPSLVATMVAALALDGGEKVLEVGTGHGYQTALLAKLAREVWSIELWSDMTEAARRGLASQGIANVRLVVGDGTLGLPHEAPFEAIVVAAAFARVPQPLIDQLLPGGRLVQPIGPGGREDVWLFTKGPTGLVRSRLLTAAHFVPLYGEHGYRLEDAPAAP